MNKTILLIEDARQVSAALEIRLRSAGYRVINTMDGPTGLKAALHESPDLILLDIWLPTGPSFSVVTELRERGIQIPVIFLTASRKPGIWKKAQEVGSADFIEKPFDAKHLLNTIQRVLTGHSFSEPNAIASHSTEQPVRTKQPV